MEIFSKIISENLIPEIPVKANKNKTNGFGVILENGENLSIENLAEIRRRTMLSPIFFVISKSRTLDISRKYARCLDECLALSSSLEEAVGFFSELAFTVSENLSGSYISFLAGTPAYISDSSNLSRSFMKEMRSCAIPEGIFIPYTKNKTNKIRNVCTKSSDFFLAAKKLRADLSAKLSRVLF